MGAKHQKFTLNLPGYSAEEREAIALEVIERIQQRTKAGKDKNGERFASYSQTYKDSLDFKNAGKSSKVNLELSGDMLDSIEILTNSSGKVTIGFEKGSTENGKADGNIRGTYGQEKAVGPKRDFLGIGDDELEKILRKYPKNTEKAADRAREKLSVEGESSRLSGTISFEDLEDLD